MGLLTESHDGWLAGFFCSGLTDPCEVECGASCEHSGLTSACVWTEFNIPGEASEAVVGEGICTVWHLTSASELLLFLESWASSSLVARRLVEVAANLHRVSLDLWMAMDVLWLDLVVSLEELGLLI